MKVRTNVTALNDDQAAALGARVLASLLREYGSWQRVTQIARMEGLFPLVRFAVEHGAVTPPLAMMASFKPVGRTARLVSEIVQEMALIVMRALDEANVTHAFVKGTAIAPLYGRLSLRPMSDTDILVHPRNFEAAREIILQLGYKQSSCSEVETNFVPVGLNPLRLPLDVHVRPDYVGQFAFHVEDMLAHAGHNGPVRALAPEDELLFLAAHVARHRMRMVGRSVCDITVLTLTREIDWDLVVGRARKWKLATATWIALACARKALGARIPVAVVNSLRPSAMQEAYLRLWLNLHRVSPYRLARLGYGSLARRGALIFLWPALSDGLIRGALFVACYSLRMLRRRTQETR